MKLKEQEHVDLENNRQLSILQHAAKEATPNSNPQRTTTNIPYEIKRLIAVKRKARSTCQRNHSLDSRKIFNQHSNKLKSKLQEMRNESFKQYVSNKKTDNSIWKPIQNRRKPASTSLPIRKYSTPPGPWAKSDKKKADLFAEHLSEVLSPHNNDPVTEKLILKKINKELNPYDWIPNHPFGFRQAHSTVQCHRITEVINKAMENRLYYTAVFLDVSQAFDKVWHPGLLIKIKRLLPFQYFNLLKSYLSERQFETKFNGETSSRFHIHSGVPQGSILGPLLYVLFTSDLPTSRGTTLGTFEDDSAILATHKHPTIASLNLQEHISSIEKWIQKWKIEVNESQSSHITLY
jgi:hypothetical protein